MLLGFLSVGTLWVIGIGQVFTKGGSWIIAAAALIVGALLVLVGLYQASLMVDDFHWVIQVTHLVLGILTIGLGHMGAARSRNAAAP
jgi:intracellular septation protein A